MDILHHFDNEGSLKPLENDKSIYGGGYSVNPTRQRIVEFIRTLHEMLPIIDDEYQWIMDKKKKREAATGKECKPFEDKSNGLARLAAAHRDLYYWYVEHPD